MLSARTARDLGLLSSPCTTLRRINTLPVSASRSPHCSAHASPIRRASASRVGNRAAKSGVSEPRACLRSRANGLAASSAAEAPGWGPRPAAYRARGLGAVDVPERGRWPPGLRSASVAYARLIKRGKVPNQRLHGFRHYQASVWLLDGHPVPRIARWLGHSDGGALLLRTYSNILDELDDAKALAEALDIRLAVEVASRALLLLELVAHCLG